MLFVCVFLFFVMFSCVFCVLLCIFYVFCCVFLLCFLCCVCVFFLFSPFHLFLHSFLRLSFIRTSFAPLLRPFFPSFLPSVFSSMIFIFLPSMISTQSNVSDVLPDGTVSAMPWRKAGVKYSQNEVYLDIVEAVDAIVGMNGQVRYCCCCCPAAVVPLFWLFFCSFARACCCCTPPRIPRMM